jgi:hypothetical protein
MDSRDEDVRTLAVGSGPLDEEAMLLLSRARTVVGPESLVAAVAHLCPPRTQLVTTTGLPAAGLDGAERPVVRLVASPEHQRG